MAEPAFDPSVFYGEYRDDPYPTLKRLRDHHPVYPLPDGSWILTRYDDVVAAFKDNFHYSNRVYRHTIDAVFGVTLMEYDGQEHTQLRNLVAGQFVGKKLAGLLPIVRRNARALVDGIAEKRDRLRAEGAACGQIELVDEFATRLPLNVIMDILDLPQDAHERFHDWYPAMMNGINGTPAHREAGVRANAEYHAYLDPLVDARSVEPGDDLISRLCTAEVDGQRMTKQQIKAFASLLLVAGAETTDKAIANLWYQLLAHPDAWKRVEQEPALLDRAFTEMMRIHPPAAGQSREVVRDLELYDQTIPKGAVVNLSIWGANHDERVFAEPERFDLDRRDLYFGRELRSGYRQDGRAGHLGFGLGKHFCVGYQLARAEAVIGSQMLLEVLRNPRFQPGFQPRPIAIGLEKQPLPLEFDL